ncbi:MAG: NTP transferase domain-containing protein [Candidatus Omnitrophica bacterium]|nr:NTP transferase domain-containing protein [Candidatus Omnitrophota bacterium]
MHEFTAIVLAAGKGVRMKSNLPKVLHEAGGSSLIYRVLRELTYLKKYVKEIVIVVGFKADTVKKEVRKYFSSAGDLSFDRSKVKFVLQKELLGTADAVKCALGAVSCGNTIILCADAPLIKRKTLSTFLADYLKSSEACSLISAHSFAENDLGRIIRDNEGAIKAIREKGDLDCGAQEKFKEVNSGIYAFDTETLRKYIEKITPNVRKQEYFLTDIIEILYNEGIKVNSHLLDDNDEILGINSCFDLTKAEEIIRCRICCCLMEQGVKILDPKTTFIAEGVKIGKNTLIYPFTFIEKNVIIGDNCSLGPFIHLRKGVNVSDNTSLGNFVEICRSKIGKNVRIKHFSYLGDAKVRDNVNIGAGTVVANYDGKNKNVTVIDKGSFIGSDTILVAPVKIGRGAVTGAGSVVTRNVKSKTVVVGVPAKLLRKKG